MSWDHGSMPLVNGMANYISRKCIEKVQQENSSKFLLAGKNGKNSKRYACAFYKNRVYLSKKTKESRNIC